MSIVAPALTCVKVDTSTPPYVFLRADALDNPAYGTRTRLLVALQLCGATADGWTGPIGRTFLSALLDVHPRSISRVLVALVREGVIRRRYAPRPLGGRSYGYQLVLDEATRRERAVLS